jgi:hypothetical protein
MHRLSSYRGRQRLVWSIAWPIAWAWCIPAGVVAQEEPTDDRGDEVYQKVFEITELVKGIGDWDTEYQNVARAVNTIWEQNGWTDEADIYARDMILDVAEIPPWDFMGRIQRFNEHVQERYDLTDEQSFRFLGVMWREAGAGLVKNFPVILKQTQEMIETRTQGQPFTPEQIAEWTKESEPLFNDFLQRADRASRQMRGLLDPEQQAVFDRDLKSFTKRVTHYAEKRKEWVQGGWRPSDWGMQDDPIQRAEHVQPGQQGAESTRIPRWLPHEPSTWFAYVLHAKKRYRFDAAQMEAAKSIHDELLERATAYAKLHAAQLRAVPKSERAVHKDYEVIRRLFTELKERIRSLVTRVQRDRTES